MPMQPSMWSFYLRELLPREMAPRFAEHGWRVLELGEEHAHDLLKEGDPARAGTAFRRFAADVGVSFPQGHFLMDTAGYRPEDAPGRRKFDLAPAEDAAFADAQDTMKRWIDLFQAAGVRRGVLHVGGIALAAAGWEPARIFARRADAVRRLAEYARGGGVRLCLENYGAGPLAAGLQTAAEMLRLAEAAGGDPIALCLDTGHAHLAGVDPGAFLREAGPRVQALHIADNLGQRDDHLLPYGAGTVPWPGVLAALRETGYDGPFNFEVPGECARCPLPARLAKLDYALALGRYMIAQAESPDTPAAAPKP